MFLPGLTDFRVILFFLDWFDDSSQSRLTAGASPEPSTVFNSNLCDRIIDIGLPAKEGKQYLLSASS